MTRCARGSAGFSLVELLVAITILALGLLAVATMQSVAISNSSISHRMMVATELANEAMEDIMAWDISHPRLNSSVSNVRYATDRAVAGAGTFNITYSTTVDTPASGTTRIDVTVTDAARLRSISPVVVTAYARVL